MSAQPSKSEQDAILERLEGAGLGVDEILRCLAQIVKADRSKCFEVSNDGTVKVRQKILPKNAVAITEVSKGRVRFADPTTAIKLALEVSKMTGKTAASEREGVKSRQGLVVLPGTISRQQMLEELPQDEEIEIEA